MASARRRVHRVDEVAADRIPWVRPQPYWVRHPHVMGVLTFAVILSLGLLLGGCEDFWRCRWC